MAVLDSMKGIGRFQWTCILLYAPTAATFIIANVVILFIAPRIDFQCTDSSPSFQNLTISEQKLMMGKDRCQRPDLDFSSRTSEELRLLLRIALKRNNGTGISMRKCDNFLYDKSMFTLTVTERFDLVCDREWLLSLAKTIYMAGFLVGAITCGGLSDRFGRKIVMVGSGIMCTAWHLLCGFAPSIEFFLLGRFLLAVCCLSFFTSGQILHTELVRMDQRKIPRAAQSYSTGIVGIIINGLALVILDYRHFQAMLAAMAFVCSLAVAYHIPESPRWLCAQKRQKEAQQIVERIAKFNKWPLERLDYLLQTTKTDDTNTKTTLLDLFRTPLIRKRTLIFCTLWFCHILVFYALLYNMDRFWPDVRVSMMISGSVELLSVCLPFFTIDFFGRQFMSSFLLISCGICCLCMAPFVTLRGSPWLLTFAITGKLLAVNQFFIGTVFIQEIYPTNIRTQGLGMASTVARIAGMLSPQLGHLNQFWPPLSVVILGFVAIFGGLLTPTLPDTTASELPVTLEDGENFFKDHTYQVQIACFRRKKRNAVEDGTADELGKFPSVNGIVKA